MPDEMYVVRLENDCLKDITRTLRRCRLLNKMKGMKPTRELYLRRRPQTGARESLTGPTPEKDNAANTEAPRINVIGAWLSSNRLRLNPGKTQFIWVGGHVQLSKIYLSILLQRFPGVLFSTTVRDLGVTLDQELTLSPHVGSVCRSCFYHLRQIRSVRRSLTS